LSYTATLCLPSEGGCPNETSVVRVPCDGLPQEEADELCRCAFAYTGPQVLPSILHYSYSYDPCGRRLGAYGPVDEYGIEDPYQTNHLPICQQYTCLEGFCAVIKKPDFSPCATCLPWMDQQTGFCHSGFCISNSIELPPCPREILPQFASGQPCQPVV
jgi:hypothetical protein